MQSMEVSEWEWSCGGVQDRFNNQSDRKGNCQVLCKVEAVVKKKRKVEVAVAMQRSGQLFFARQGVVDPGARKRPLASEIGRGQSRAHAEF